MGLARGGVQAAWGWAEAFRGIGEVKPHLGDRGAILTLLVFGPEPHLSPVFRASALAVLDALTFCRSQGLLTPPSPSYASAAQEERCTVSWGKPGATQQ